MRVESVRVEPVKAPQQPTPGGVDGDDEPSA